MNTRLRTETDMILSLHNMKSKISTLKLVIILQQQLHRLILATWHLHQWSREAAQLGDDEWKDRVATTQKISMPILSFVWIGILKPSKTMDYYCIVFWIMIWGSWNMETTNPKPIASAFLKSTYCVFVYDTLVGQTISSRLVNDYPLSRVVFTRSTISNLMICAVRIHAGSCFQRPTNHFYHNIQFNVIICRGSLNYLINSTWTFRDILVYNWYTNTHILKYTINCDINNPGIKYGVFQSINRRNRWSRPPAADIDQQVRANKQQVSDDCSSDLLSKNVQDCLATLTSSRTSQLTFHTSAE